MSCSSDTDGETGARSTYSYEYILACTLRFLTGTEYETRPDVRCPHAWPGIRPGLGVAAVVHIN